MSEYKIHLEKGLQKIVSMTEIVHATEIHRLFGRKLGHELAYFSGPTQWYRHVGF